MQKYCWLRLSIIVQNRINRRPEVCADSAPKPSELLQHSFSLTTGFYRGYGAGKKESQIRLPHKLIFRESGCYHKGQPQINQIAAHKHNPETSA